MKANDIRDALQSLPTSEPNEDMLAHVQDRLDRNVKPSSTYEKCIERITYHAEQLNIAYDKLFETYRRAVTPVVRTSPIDRARADMMADMDDKMLRSFASMHIADKANDYILPGEREELIDATVAAMRKGASNA